jgi:hypothetical protein
MYKLKAVGADPEFFLFDPKNKNPIPAIGMIGGTKDRPQFINEDGFSAIQEDNVMVEFNIKPARTAEEFVDNVLVVRNYLDIKCKILGMEPLIVPHAEFEPAMLKHPQAQAIGCLADFSAWTWRQNVPLTPIDLGLVRVAGGHIHVSYSYKDGDPQRNDQHEVVRMLDLAVGVPAVVLDEDAVRRRFYGKAGCFRPKKYGVEYRTASNFWIAHRDMIEWTFNQVVWAFKRLKECPRLMPADEEAIQMAINDNNKAVAQELIKHHSIPMPA